MEYPKYIAVIRSGKRSSHMSLNIKSENYETYGWSLPLENIEVRQGKLYITDFMPHLNGCRLEPLSKTVFLKDLWGIKANYSFKEDI